MKKPTPALYLRTDGTLLLVRGDSAIELALTARQLLQLGLDCLQVAVSLDPASAPIAAGIMESVVVPPALHGAVLQSLSESTVTPEAPCHKLN